MPAWCLGVQGTHSFIDGTILACREAWSDEGDLPRQVVPWKSIEEVQQILRELGMRQIIYATVFKGPH